MQKFSLQPVNEQLELNKPETVIATVLVLSVEQKLFF